MFKVTTLDIVTNCKQDIDTKKKLKMEEVHKERKIETAGYARGVWLLKVPNYLATIWKNAGEGSEVGKLTMTQNKATFSLADELAKSDVPKDHKCVSLGAGPQELVAFSREQHGVSADIDYPPEKVAIEGKVIQRAECQPYVNKNYIELKRKTGQNARMPKRQAIQLDGIIQNYKPKSYHEHHHTTKDNKETKRTRLPEDQVQALLFCTFEEHQYYRIEDLVRITQQPMSYLKEILRMICKYNVKAPHKNMWELKPEYRHYKGQSNDN